MTSSCDIRSPDSSPPLPVSRGTEMVPYFGWAGLKTPPIGINASPYSTPPPPFAWRHFWMTPIINWLPLSVGFFLPHSFVQNNLTRSFFSPCYTSRCSNSFFLGFFSGLLCCWIEFVAGLANEYGGKIDFFVCADAEEESGMFFASCLSLLGGPSNNCLSVWFSVHS